MAKWANQGALSKLSAWVQSAKDKGPFTQAAFLVGLLLLVFFPIASFFSLIAFSLPWVPAILIPICICMFFVLAGIRFACRANANVLLGWARICLIIPVCFWTGVFLFGFVCYFASNILELRLTSAKLRFPLAQISGIAVDGKGRVFCFSRLYNRLQVYDAAGNFLRGWFVDIPTGAFRILVDEQDSIRLASKRSGWNFFFDAHGHLVDKTKRSDFTKEFGWKSPTKVSDSLGNSYKIQSGKIWSKVIKTTPSGAEVELVSDPCRLRLVTAPVPAVPLSAVLLVLQGMVAQLYKR